MEQTEQVEQAKRKTIGAGVRFIATVLLFLVVFWVFFEVFNAKRQGRVPTFFGYSFSVVITGSMEPDIHVGELLVVRKTDIEEIEIGDDILFISKSGVVAGQHIVHRVIDKGTDEKGLWLQTKGTHNAGPDEALVRSDNFVGKAVAHSVFWGKIFSFLTNTEALMMLAVLVLAAPFALKQILRIVRATKTDETEGKEEKEGKTDHTPKGNG